MNFLLYLVLSSYLLGIIFMFFPERWLTKRYKKNIVALEKQAMLNGYKKQFLIIGFTIIATLLFVKYVV